MKELPIDEYDYKEIKSIVLGNYESKVVRALKDLAPVILAISAQQIMLGKNEEK